MTFTTHEAAVHLGVSDYTIRWYIAYRGLPTTRTATIRHAIDLDNLAHWADKNRAMLNRSLNRRQWIIERDSR